MNKNKIPNLSKDYLINLKGDFIRLRKGMTKQEVKNILGEPYKIENCTNLSNKKLFFKIKSDRPANVTYSILFTEESLIYVVKIN